MTKNAKTEPEVIEMSYATVRSTNDYTAEHGIVELETTLDLASYGVPNKFFSTLLNQFISQNTFRYINI